MKCGCKRNLLGVCSCKRVSRGRGRKTRRAITDEPYERAIKARYAVPRTRKPEYNFPAIDPKRPGQVLKPGVPSVSTGFIAPSPFSRGATSAFEPVLRAASNYLNEVTRTARLQNQMTMSNMGGGGSSSNRNILMNGSTNSRNTQSLLNRNPGLAPLNENPNVINSDGTNESWRNNLNQFENNAATAIRNFNRTSPISIANSSVQEVLPQNVINYQDEVDQAVAENDLNSSTQAISDNNLEEILQENENINDSVSEVMNQSMDDNDKFLLEKYVNGDDKKKDEILKFLRKRGKENEFYEAYKKWNALGSPKPNMKNVVLSGDFRDTPMSQRSNFEEFVNRDSTDRVRTFKVEEEENNQAVQNLDQVFDNSMSPIPNRPLIPSSSSSSSRTLTASTPSSIGSKTGISSSSSIGSKSSSKGVPGGNNPLSLNAPVNNVFGNQSTVYSSPDSNSSGSFTDPMTGYKIDRDGNMKDIGLQKKLDDELERIKNRNKRISADQEVAAKQILSPNTRQQNKQQRTKKDKDETQAAKNLKQSEAQENKSKTQKMREYNESLKKK